MKYFRFVIMILSLVSLHIGCRAKLDTNSSTLRRQTDVIGLELRKLDSLCSSSSERLTYKIEFYPTEYARQNPATPEALDSQAAPVSTMPATNVGGLPLSGNVGGGMGAVKSIEITNEKKEEVSSTTIVDSTHNEAKMTQETVHDSTVTEARQDNGTVATVCVVFAVAALIYLVIKSMLK